MGARFDWRRGGRGEAGASGPRAFPGLYPLWPTKAREVARPLQVPWACRLLAMTMAGARAAAFGESGGRLCWKRGRSLPPMRWMRGEAAAVPLLQGGEEALERFAGAIWSFGDMAPLPWPLGWWCDLGRKVDDIS